MDQARIMVRFRDSFRHLDLRFTVSFLRKGNLNLAFMYLQTKSVNFFWVMLAGSHALYIILPVSVYHLLK